MVKGERMLGLAVLAVFGSLSALAETTVFSVRPGEDLVAVRDRVRAGRGGATNRVEIVLEDGVYALDRQLALTAEDSGVTWRARHPGKVTVVGGAAFRGADAVPLADGATRERLVPEVRGRVLALPVPEALRARFDTPFFGTPSENYGVPRFGTDGVDRSPTAPVRKSLRAYPMFTIDRRLMEPAQYPNGRRFQPVPKEALVRAAQHFTRPHVGFTNAVVRCESPRAKSWRFDCRGAAAFGFLNGCPYSTELRPLAGVTPEGNVEVDTSFWHSRVNAGPVTRIRFINVLEELDAPGEWCYAPDPGVICFLPPEGFGPDSVLAVGFVQDDLVRITGSDITLEGLAFTAKIAYPALTVEEGRRNRVLGCTFSGLDYVGVCVAGRDNLVRSCDFLDCNAAGLYLVGGVAKTADWGGNVVENCLFRDCCQMKCGWATGALYVDGAGNRASHCEVSGSPEHGLDYAGVNQVVEYCRIHDVNTEFLDSAAVYSPGGFRSYGCVFRFNEVGASPGRSEALYLDDFTSGHMVYGNVFRDAGDYGFFMGGGRDNVISNNLVVNCWAGFHMDNRGLFWPAYANHSNIHERLVRAFDYEKGPLAKLYPAWAKWNDDPGRQMFGYQDDKWINNITCRTFGNAERTQLCGEWRIADSNRVTSVGNLFVDPDGTAKEWIDDYCVWGFGGLRKLIGTKENPIDPGIVDLPEPRFDPTLCMRKDGWVDEELFYRMKLGGEAEMKPYRRGDLRFRADSILRREVPGWQDIPFDRIGLVRDDWRTGDETVPFLVAERRNPKHPALCFRRTVACAAEIRRAELRIVGLGVFEARINGRRVSSEELKPGFTMPFARQRYAFDVTGLVRRGRNVVEIETAGSYWCDALVDGRFSRPVGVSCELELVGSDGARTVIPSDGSWQVADCGPLVDAGIYEGENYDATRADIPESAWRPASVSNLTMRTVPARGAVVARGDLAFAAHVPFAVRPGERRTVDFGQNCAGREAFTVKGPRGAVVTIRHAEALNADGSCYFDNLRQAAATTRYVLGGEGEESYRPRFTYYGFRAVEISASAPVEFTALTLEPLTSVSRERETGSLRTSDPDVNRIIACAEWSLRSNQLSVPTDCAQRDERQPWIGDACVSVPATCWFWDARDFYAKSLRDQRDVQKPDGRYSAIAPGHVSWMHDSRFGTVAWADAGILIPYQVWRHFGDASELAGHYPSMCRYAGWLERSGGPVPSGWGDWLAFERTGCGLPEYPYASDPDTFAFLAAAYRVWDFRALAEIAAALGKVDDARRFGELRDRALADARKRLFAADGALDGRYASQTALSLSLALGLCPDDAARTRAVNDLVASVRNAGGRLMTGILGTSFILGALSENGRADVAYDLLLNRTCPSWLYMVDRGATTLWEHWDGILGDGRFNTPTMNSFNHAEFASVLDWMYRTMAGIRPNGASGGFANPELAPVPDRRIRRVEASYQSDRGLIRTESEFLPNEEWRYSWWLPDGVSAVLRLPGCDPVAVTGSGSRTLLAAGEKVR